MFFGATTSIIRGVRTPVLFSMISGLQWFGISSVFYGILPPAPWPGRSAYRQLQQGGHHANLPLQAQGR